MDIAVVTDAARLTRACTARPCYTATVNTTVATSASSSPTESFVVSVAVNENRWIRQEIVAVSQEKGPSPSSP